MDETTWNKIYVDLIGPYNILRKGKFTLMMKAVTMIDPVTVWSKVTQYDNKIAMKIANLVETTWLSRYPWPSEIMYDREYEFLGLELKNTSIE